MIKRLYLAGPMSGLPNFNYPRFNEEAERLRSLGYEVINPAELHLGEPQTFATEAEFHAHWRGCMRTDLAQLLTCDAVAMLDGWTKSRGALIEHYIAHQLGIQPILASFFVEHQSVAFQESACSN